jgi:hypothetical protein
LTEEQIESIVAEYARFDTTDDVIVLLPSASALTNRQRVLIYLVAMRGWPFVKEDDPPPTAATPAELEKALNIAGNSLRPIPKRLKDARLIDESDGRYSVNPVTFPFLKKELIVESAESPSETEPKPRRRASRGKKAARSQTEDVVDLEAPASETDNRDQEEPDPPPSGSAENTATRPPSKRTKRDATSAGAGPLQRLRGLIAGGWFSKPRSTRDMVAEFAKRGLNYKRTDLTRQLLTLTRNEELVRDKARPPEGGPDMWFYRAP